MVEKKKRWNTPPPFYKKRKKKWMEEKNEKEEEKMGKEKIENLTSDLVNEISWNFINKNCVKKGVEIKDLKMDSKLFMDIEEEAIACFINTPKLIETTILKEFHFVNKEMGVLFTFFKKIYEIYGDLSIPVMLSRAKDKERLYCLVRIVCDYSMGLNGNFRVVENELIEKYRLTQIKDEFMKAIYGDCSIEEFKKNIEEI